MKNYFVTGDWSQSTSRNVYALCRVQRMAVEWEGKVTQIHLELAFVKIVCQ